MNTQRLCPVYRKWLQLNPRSARQHRIVLQARTQLAHQQGKLSRSCPYMPRRPLHVALSPLFNIHLISRGIPMV